ncbi:hypothetical protein GIY23_19685 [Allosaccharopolyspora coralli]|uniref:Uncharacterized protein n=1 Tax=Allosaccharopolyspora coralli TaxID=2665642 RepID=A0A5Q3QDZ3_9PSEU|nr:DUF6350 family protein [Allosaccharopolyspora coralli]QGK71434.1 hypothetical protein GIY23_19685 [Allosaccharopolyspora coralli]
MTALGNLPHTLAERATGTRHTGTRWLLLAAVVGAVVTAGYLALAGVVAAVMATAGGDFSLPAVLLAALPAWLAAHQVPLSISGAPLDVLPLLPTAFVVLLIAASCSGFARRAQLRSAAQTARVILVMGVVHATAGAVIAVLVRGGSVVAVPLDAFVWCGLTATTAAGLGMADRSGLITLVWSRVSEPVWTGIELGVRVLLVVAMLAALVFLSGLGLSASQLFAASPSWGDGFGMIVVSLLYLPNAMLAAWSFVVGPGFSVGALEVSPFGVRTGPVPDLPLFAALPASTGALWWFAVFVVPVVVGALLGWWCRNADEAVVPRISAVLAGAAVVATAVGCLALLTGGRLGGADFEPVSMHAGWAALATVGWLAVPGALVSWLFGPRAQVAAPDGVEPLEGEGSSSGAETAPEEPHGDGTLDSEVPDPDLVDADLDDEAPDDDAVPEEGGDPTEQVPDDTAADGEDPEVAAPEHDPLDDDLADLEAAEEDPELAWPRRRDDDDR